MEYFLLYITIIDYLFVLKSKNTFNFSHLNFHVWCKLLAKTSETSSVHTMVLLLCERTHNLRGVFMRLSTFVLLLLFAHLFCAGCLYSKTLENVEAKQEGLPPLTAVTGTGTLPDSTTDNFTFAVFGDSQGGDEARAIISKIFSALHDHRHRRPAFAFSLGDIVKGKDPRDPAKYIKQKFEEYLQMAATAGIPVFNAPGNHEMDDKGDIPSEKMHEIYKSTIGASYGSFDYGNSHFIGLNTEDVPPAGTQPPPDGQEFSYISDKQFKQLDSDLSANMDKTHIFIMMHYPMKPQRPQNSLNPESLKKLNQILTQYKNISYILASHEHLYYNPQDPDNVTTVSPFKVGDPTRYLISGGAGAGIYVPEDKGGFHHYLLFEVNGETVSVTIHRING